MEKKRATNGKLKAFLKKNVYFIVMGVSILAIAALITVAVVTTQDKEDIGNINPPQDNVGDDTPTVKPDDTKPDDTTPDLNPDDTKPDNKPVPTPIEIVFASPVADVNVTKDYSIDTLVWHATLKQYSVHEGMDFAGSDGTEVMAVYDGVITDVKYDVLNGYTVVVKHNDTLSTTYSSLNEPTLTVGHEVKKGEVIGTMGTTATNEYLDGAHLHLCMYEDGVLANPNKYFSFGDK